MAFLTGSGSGWQGSKHGPALGLGAGIRQDRARATDHKG